MNTLNVNINKARVTGFSLDFEYDGPEKEPRINNIAVNVDLFTETGTKVTSLIMHTHYHSTTKFKRNQLEHLSFDFYNLLRKLETEAVIAINNIQHSIPQNATEETNYNSDITKED